MALPASIRHRNPGAMGLGKSQKSSAKRFGATKQTTLNDGYSNVIALFPTSVDGAAAQFHLLASKSYFGLKIEDAISKWSNGDANPTDLNDYLAAIERDTEWSRTDYLDNAILGKPETAIEFARAMAKHEAGQTYPLTDAEWLSAYNKAFDKTATVAKAAPVPVDLLTKFGEVSDADLGQKEVPGKGANPVMVNWYADAGHPEIKSDEVSNCAAAMCSWLERSGCANPKTLLARDFLEYGTPLPEPVENCICVIWRGSPNSWQGHVFRVKRWSATHVWGHGANQGNEVNVKPFPRSQVLGYRLPLPATRSVVEIASDTSMQRKVIGGTASLGMLLWSTWQTITTAASYAYEGAGHLIGILPDTAATAQAAASSGQALADTAGLPWPMILSQLIVVCAIGGGIALTWKRLRTVNPWATEQPQ